MPMMTPNYILNMLRDAQTNPNAIIPCDRQILLTVLEQFYELRKTVAEDEQKRYDAIRDATVEAMQIWFVDIISDVQKEDLSGLSANDVLEILKKNVKVTKEDLVYDR